MKKKPQPLPMFATEDLPLFSGTPQTAHEETFKPRPPGPKQLALTDAPIETLPGNLWRSYDDIIAALDAIKDSTDDARTQTICYALEYGLTTQRTTIHFESYLYRAADLAQVVQTIRALWDGSDYISGILLTAHQHYHRLPILR